VPKAESDAVLKLLFHELSENLDIQVRFKWEVNSVAIWDNRVSFYLLFADVVSRVPDRHPRCVFQLLARNAPCAEGNTAR
jgi:hypothetical protein